TAFPMKTSRAVLLPVLVAVLAVAGWLGWQMTRPAPGEGAGGRRGAPGGGGGGRLVATGESGGAGAADLQAGTRDPAALEADAEAEDAHAHGAGAGAGGDGAAPQATRTVQGRVLLPDGVKRPEGLAVHASFH